MLVFVYPLSWVTMVIPNKQTEMIPKRCRIWYETRIFGIEPYFLVYFQVLLLRGWRTWERDRGAWRTGMIDGTLFLNIYQSDNICVVKGLFS